MSSALMIEISGYAQVGKDTAADLMVERINKDNRYKAKKFSFAKQVKIKTAEKYNINIQDLLDNIKKLMYRQEMISVGDNERDNNPYIWCEMLQKELDEFIKECESEDKKPVILLADNRYYNEIYYYRDKKKYNPVKMVKTIHLICNEKIWKERLKEKYLDHLELRKNRSERDINQFNFDFDFIIANNSTKNYLSNVLTITLSQILSEFENNIKE